MSKPSRSLILAAALAAMVLAVQACADDAAGPQQTHVLTVVLEGLGFGTVTSDPAGIACAADGGTCSAPFDAGAQVALTAAPDVDQAFVAWSGGATGASATTTVTMDADRSVTAEFDHPDLAVQAVGSDGGTVVSRDGLVTLTFPAGALAADQEITIERVELADLGPEWADMVDDITHAYEFGPDGLTFDSPVEVSMDAETIAFSGDTALIPVPRMATAVDGTVESLDSILAYADLKSGESTLRGLLSHFSPFRIMNDESEGTEFRVTDAPDEVPIGSEFTIFVAANGEFSGSDYSFHLLTPDTFVSAESGAFGGAVLTFRCNEIGEIAVDVAVTVPDPDDPEIRRGVWFTTTVNCTGATLRAETTGEGSGTVSTADGTPGPIVCGTGGSACSADFPLGAVVGLLATPDPGSTVKSCTETTEVAPEDPADCTVSIDADEHVIVEFGLAPTEVVSVTIENNGTVTGGGFDCVRESGVTSGVCEQEVGGVLTLYARLLDGSLVTDVLVTGDGEVNDRGEIVLTPDGEGSTQVHVTNPTPPESPFFQAMFEALEGLSFFPFGFPFPVGEETPDALPYATIAADGVGAACPDLLGAGKDGAVVFDACTGEVVHEYPYLGDNFYDALALYPPAGYDGVHQILMTGQNWVHCYVEDDGTTGIGCLGSAGGANMPDAQLIDPDDPTRGALVVDNIGWSQVRFIVFDPEQGYFDSHYDRFGGVDGIITSAVAGVPAEDPTMPPNESLVVGWMWVGEESPEKVGVVNHAEMYPADSEYSEGTLVGELPGNDPRRIRCDLDAGICAVSDFTGDQVTILLWNGTGMPTIAGTTAPGEVADGPVGLDVFGNRVVVAGFNDDQYTILEVDEAGAIASATTAALPAGCTQPGHAMFLKDGANTIIVSCWGSGGFARIPGAF